MTVILKDLENKFNLNFNINDNLKCFAFEGDLISFEREEYKGHIDYVFHLTHNATLRIRPWMRGEPIIYYVKIGDRTQGATYDGNGKQITIIG